MRILKTIVVTAIIGLLLALSPLRAAEAIRISIPASMTDALQEVAAQFEASGQYPPIVFNSGPSGALAKQIVEGAPADLFVSANRKWMSYLRDEKMIDPATETLLATNTLVFVGMPNPAVTAMADIVQLQQIAIGSPKSVPAGEYAAQAMDKAGLLTQLEGGKKLVMAKDVRQALVYADRGETGGAFVYKTDALLATRAVVLFEVPQELYEPITYPVALTVEGAKKAAARAFHAYLAGPEARQIFRKHGFSAAP